MLTGEDKKDIAQIVAEQIDTALEKFAIIINGNFDRIEKRIDSIEERMATKEDLKAFATKEDLENMEERLMYRYERRIELLEDRQLVIKNHLKLS